MPLANSLSSIASEPSIPFTQVHLPLPGCSPQVQPSPTHSYQLPRFKSNSPIRHNNNSHHHNHYAKQDCHNPHKTRLSPPPRRSREPTPPPIRTIPISPLLSSISVSSCEYWFCGTTGQILDSCGREKSEEAVLRSGERVRGLALWGYWGCLWFFGVIFERKGSRV